MGFRIDDYDDSDLTAAQEQICAAQRVAADGERARIVAWLRRDVGANLERYYERLRVADDLERGEHLKSE